MSKQHREKGIWIFVEPRRLSIHDFRLDGRGLVVTDPAPDIRPERVRPESNKWFLMPTNDTDCFSFEFRLRFRRRPFDKAWLYSEDFYFLGWKVRCDYFDTNVCLEFCGIYDRPDVPLDAARRKLIRDLRKNYTVTLPNETIIHVAKKNLPGKF